MIVKANSGNYTPVPAGNHLAMCYSVVGIGTQYNKMYDKHQEKLIITWELPDETMEVDGKTLPMSISKTYTANLSEKSNLRKDLASWRGRDFSEEELKGFEMKSILGKPCMLNVMAQMKGDRTYSDVSSIGAIPKGMEHPDKTVNPLRMFDVENPATLEQIKTLPEWMQALCKASAEYQKQDPAEDFQEVENDADLPF